MIENLLAYGLWVAIVLIIVGFVALVKGADWLVDGASAIAKRSGISDLVIGLTVVAFGTSMPEFVVNMFSIAEGTTDLALTNILGSNIINTFVILGFYNFFLTLIILDNLILIQNLFPKVGPQINRHI